MSNRDYYCSNKFKFLKIDLERQLTYNCHAARPHPINFEWLEKNPGNIFNIPINVLEREMMLMNQRNSSCEQNCWPAEDKGQISVRMLQGGVNKTHCNVYTRPEILDITLDTDCRLACIYCCKEYSSTWRNEIKKFGDYKFSSPSTDLVNRFTLDNKDKIIHGLTQNQKFQSQRYQQLLDETFRLLETAKEIVITGGEPLLSIKLVDLLKKSAHLEKVKLFSGLGVSSTKLEKILNSVDRLDNIEFTVSAENINSDYEFVRHGATFEQFVKNLAVLDARGIKYKFHSTISNLSLFGFNDFYQMFHHRGIEIDFAYTPAFLAPNVLDADSKQAIVEKLSMHSNVGIINQILESIKADSTEAQRINLKEFLNQMSQRRSIDLSGYPNTFIDWIFK